MIPLIGYSEIHYEVSFPTVVSQSREMQLLGLEDIVDHSVTMESDFRTEQTPIEISHVGWEIVLELTLSSELLSLVFNKNLCICAAYK